MGNTWRLPDLGGGGGFLAGKQTGTRRYRRKGGATSLNSELISVFQENFFDIQEALQAIHMRQEMLREQLAFAKSKGEETVGRNLQVGARKRENGRGRRGRRRVHVCTCGKHALRRL